MSYVDILPAATPSNSAIHLNPKDNVVIARVPLEPGRRLLAAGGEIEVLEAVPAGHKVAITAIEAGAPVIRYGENIGRASRTIRPGEHVHVHNLAYEEISMSYEFPAADRPPAPPASSPSWRGYLREDGRAGTRNYIAVVAASNCAAHTVEAIARGYEGADLPQGVDGVVAFPHGEGCGHAIGPDTAQLQRVLWGILDHPNVSAAVVLGLGCEVNQIDHYLGAAAGSANRRERVVGLTLQESGGTRATVEAARRRIAKLIERAAEEKRVELPASKICLGLNCGGSDSFSGITANPALGWCSDRLAEVGATAVLAETPEIFGAEHLLVRRARNRAVAERLLEMIEKYRAYLRQFEGTSFDDNPSPGNKEGGLTNILEKSLGAVAKSGSSILNEVVDYAERISGPGFVFMNTPGYDPVSLTGLAAGGVNLIAFTTGRGSAIGFPTVPVVKIATNSAVFKRMRDNMDVNAGRIADGAASVEETGREIFELVLRAASGERTAAELNGHREFVPWRIGPVM
ncbi:MAG: altronate dehydratase [Bryobacteraceae bacterium]|nr:altronate dehydratase [Bryobacteraceae bacterium]